MGIRECRLSTTEHTERGMERAGGNFQNQLNKQSRGYRKRIEEVAHYARSWREWRTQPRAFVSPLGIERIPGICRMTISLASAHPYRYGKTVQWGHGC